jgi:hypothetical protein
MLGSMGLAVPRSGVPPPATTTKAATAQQHQPPMLRIDYGKPDESVSSRKEVPGQENSAAATVSKKMDVLSRSPAKSLAEHNRRVSRLDSTIARLRGNLGRGSSSSGQGAAESVRPGVGTGIRRLSTAEKKVPVQVFRHS